MCKSQSVTLHVGLLSLQYDMQPLSEKMTFDPTPGVEAVCKDSIFATMVLCAQFPLI